MNYLKKFRILVLFVFGIFFFFLNSNIIGNNKLELINYLNNLDDVRKLLNIIKEKEQKLFNYEKKRRNEIKKEIKNIYKTIIKIKKQKLQKIINNDGKFILSCSYSLNNEYIYQTLVSMISLVLNAGKNTFYNIYVLITPDFTERNKKILMSVEKNYIRQCKIILISF